MGYPRPGWKNDQVNCQVLADSSPNRPAYRCRRRCLLPTGRNHLHDALQSHRLPFWFGLAGSISDTVRCRRGQLYLGIPDTYPCRAARLSRWSGGTKSNHSTLNEGALVCGRIAWRPTLAGSSGRCRPPPPASRDADLGGCSATGFLRCSRHWLDRLVHLLQRPFRS